MYTFAKTLAIFSLMLCGVVVQISWSGDGDPARLPLDSVTRAQGSSLQTLASHSRRERVCLSVVEEGLEEQESDGSEQLPATTFVIACVNSIHKSIPDRLRAAARLWLASSYSTTISLRC